MRCGLQKWKSPLCESFLFLPLSSWSSWPFWTLLLLKLRLGQTGCCQQQSCELGKPRQNVLVIHFVFTFLERTFVLIFISWVNKGKIFLFIFDIAPNPPPWEYIFVSIITLLESTQAPVRLRENANDLLTIPPLSVPTMLKNQVGYFKMVMMMMSSPSLLYLFQQCSAIKLVTIIVMIVLQVMVMVMVMVVVMVMMIILHLLGSSGQNSCAPRKK